MRNKRLIIVVCLLLFVVALIVLFSSLFQVKNIKIEGTFCSVVTQEEKDEICSDEFFPINSSIFFVNKNEIISNLEKNYPLIKIINIETVFPSSIIIHTEAREEIYYVKVTEDEFYSLDKMGKVLKKYYSQPNLIAVKGLNQTTINNLSLGHNLADNIERSEIYNTYLGFFACNYEIADFKSFAKRVEISSNQIKIITNNSASIGTTIEIENPQVNLCNKLIYALSTYNALTEEQKTHGTISVTEKLNNSDEFNVGYLQ